MSESINNLTRDQILRNLERAMGISYADMETLTQTLGKGMDEGLVRFVPGTGEEGLYGTLHYTQEREDKRVAKTHEVRNSSEAGFLVALQAKVDQKRRQP